MWDLTGPLYLKKLLIITSDDVVNKKKKKEIELSGSNQSSIIQQNILFDNSHGQGFTKNNCPVCANVQRQNHNNNDK